jgi:hypothetical protein
MEGDHNRCAGQLAISSAVPVSDFDFLAIQASPEQRPRGLGKRIRRHGYPPPGIVLEGGNLGNIAQ